MIAARLVRVPIRPQSRHRASTAVGSGKRYLTSTSSMGSFPSAGNSGTGRITQTIVAGQLSGGKMPRIVTVARVGEIADGEARTVCGPGKAVSVFRDGEQYFAI